MNENARKLVEALKSGKYKQGTGQLRKDRNFCCLGVACDLFRKETHQGRWQRRYPGSDAWLFLTPDGESNGSDLPPAVAEWLGMKYEDGSYDNSVTDDDCDDGSLIDLNDNLGYNFTQIAEVIESEPKGLFK